MTVIGNDRTRRSKCKKGINTQKKIAMREGEGAVWKVAGREGANVASAWS